MQKQVLEERLDIKKRVFMQISLKTGSEKKSLDRLRCFWQDYRCRREKIMLFKSFSVKCQIIRKVNIEE